MAISTKRRPLCDYPEYTADSLTGKIYKGDREISQKLSEKDGVMYLTLIDAEGKHHRRRVAHLVYSAFHPSEDFRYIDYLDGNPKNCALANLKIGSAPKMNLGASNGNVKLTAEKVRTIRASELTATKLAEKYGVSESTIFSIKSGRRWAHIV